jgi:hypothetical protein
MSPFLPGISLAGIDARTTDIEGPRMSPTSTRRPIVEQTVEVPEDGRPESCCDSAAPDTAVSPQKKEKEKKKKDTVIAHFAPRVASQQLDGKQNYPASYQVRPKATDTAVNFQFRSS